MLPYSHATVYVPMYTFVVTHWRAHRHATVDIQDALNYGRLIFSLPFSLYSLDAQQESMRWAVFVFCVCTRVRLSSCLPLSVPTVIDVSLWSHCASSFKPPSFFFYPAVIHPFKHTMTRWEHASCTRTCLSFLSITQLIRLAHKCWIFMCSPFLIKFVS